MPAPLSYELGLSRLGWSDGAQVGKDRVREDYEDHAAYEHPPAGVP